MTIQVQSKTDTTLVRALSGGARPITPIRSQRADKQPRNAGLSRAELREIVLEILG